MYKLTLLLIPLILLSSCTMNMDEKNTTPQPVTDNQSKTLGTPVKPTEHTLSGMTKDFGSGFILSQTDNETVLSYSGKIVKAWSNTLSENGPYLWEQHCPYLEEIYNKIETKETDKNWRKIVWQGIEKSKQDRCIREYLWGNIRTEQLTERFFEIIQTNYETATLWIYDTVSGNLQQMPTMGILKLTESKSGATIFIDMTYGDDNMKLLYNNNFSELLSKEEIPK